MPFSDSRRGLPLASGSKPLSIALNNIIVNCDVNYMQNIEYIMTYRFNLNLSIPAFLAALAIFQFLSFTKFKALFMR